MFRLSTVRPPQFLCHGLPIAAASLMLAAPASAQTSEPMVAFGTKHAVALKTNGDVVTWGDNIGCQLGRRTGNNTSTPGLVMRNAKEVAAASEHTLVLTSDGKVYAWGTNSDGVLGVGDTWDKCEGPVLVESLADKTVTHIATGYAFSVAVTSDGHLYCAGDNSMNQCGAGRVGHLEKFTAVPFPAIAGTVDTVKAGMFHTLVVTRDRSLYAFGRGLDGQLGDGRTVTGFAQRPALTGVVSFAAGTWHSVALKDDGTVWTWGNNSKSQLCGGGTANRSTPSPVAVPGGAAIGEVAAGGHGTLLRTTNGVVYACGDNQSGSLGLDAQMVVPQLTSVPAVTAKTLFLGIGHAAFSPDGCALKMAGWNDAVAASASPTSRTAVFTPRANLSLCAAPPAAPLATIVNPAPKGGTSGCWSPRKEEDASTSPKFSALRQAMLSAEGLLKRNTAWMGSPEPVRMRTALSAGPFAESGARMHVKAVAERKIDGTRVWGAGECDVIPQIDRIGGAIAQVSIFFNLASVEQFVGTSGQAPKRTGDVGGYPEYNGWVVITKDGRLPWVPVTLDDKLTAEGARREKALAEWLKTSVAVKAPDPAVVQQTSQMLKKSDAAGAEKYLASMKELAEEAARQQRDVTPAMTAGLERQISDYKKYRATFTPDELKSPAVWGDASGAGKRTLDARIAALQALTPAEQQQADGWFRESRDLERQAQAEAKGGNADAAKSLRERANQLGLQIKTLRKRRLEQASPLIEQARAEYDLTNLRPGDAANAMGFKDDPAFLDRSDPNRIQIITVMFSESPDPKQVARLDWQRKAKESFDWAALAALLK